LEITDSGRKKEKEKGRGGGKSAINSGTQIGRRKGSRGGKK